MYRTLPRLLILIGLLTVAVGAAAQGASPAGTYRLVLPNPAAAVEITLPTSYAIATDTRPDPFGRYVAGTLTGTGIDFAIGVIGGLGRPDVDQCALERLQALLDGRRIVRQEETSIQRTPDKALFAYLSRADGTLRHHEWAFLATEDACVSLHLSKASLDAEDRKTFATVLTSMVVRKSGEPAK